MIYSKFLTTFCVQGKTMSKSIRITIDPTQIEQIKSIHNDIIPVLKSFLYHNEECGIWHANNCYKYEHNKVNYKFTFTQSLLKRNAKDNYRFELFNLFEKPLGKGAYGLVFPINGTIKFTYDELVLKQGNRRLVKIQASHSVGGKINVRNEFIKLLQAGHLHPKPPVFNEDLSYLVMNRAKGISLEQLLHPQKRKEFINLYAKLTISKRLELFHQILLAIKHQIKDRKLVHRDIKPGNIIIDLETDPPTVVNIDYGFAINYGSQDHRRLGTRAYRAPETFLNIPIYTFESDIYATARVLSYLFGDFYSNYYITRSKSWNQIKRKSTNKYLFSAPEIALFLNDEEQFVIRGILSDMLHETPEKRPSIEQVIERFSLINIKKYKNAENAVHNIPDFKYQLNKQINSTHTQLLLLREKYLDLLRRECLDAAETMNNLISKLTIYTHFLQENPTPYVLQNYRLCCVKEINLAKEKLQQHRDNKWILAEVSAAFGLLGIGYLVALGVKYWNTGRLGLFSQTKSDQLTDTVKNSVLGVP